RDGSPGRPALRLRRHPPRARRSLGAHLLSRLRRPPDRALRVRDQTAARRAGWPLPLLPPPHPWGLVVAALFLLQAAVGAAAPPAGRATFDAATFDPIIESGIRAGAYPGAALIVGRADTILFRRGYGRFTWSSRSATVDPDSTLFDLASLTKSSPRRPPSCSSSSAAPSGSRPPCAATSPSSRPRGRRTSPCVTCSRTRRVCGPRCRFMTRRTPRPRCGACLPRSRSTGRGRGWSTPT